MTGVMTELRRRAHIDAIVERVDLFAVPRNWAAGAPCIDQPDDMFFPTSGRATLARQGEQLCATCPKRAVCLIDALQREQHLGAYDVTGRRYLSGRERLQILADRHSPPAAPDVNGHDDVALMLALCTRIAHNLNNDGDPQ